MGSNKTRKQKRLHDRRIQVIREAIRSRQFSTEELTKQAVEFILEGLKIADNRNEIIETAQKK